MTYDKDIRELLFDFLEERFGKIRIIEEKKKERGPRTTCHLGTALVFVFMIYAA